MLNLRVTNSSDNESLKESRNETISGLNAASVETYAST